MREAAVKAVGRMNQTDESLDAARLLTAAEAAHYLGLAEGTVRNRASANEIPFVKLGRSLRFRRSELDQWVKERDAEAKGQKAGDSGEAA